ncbi:PDZ and LIM domain protein Zasp isoform X12 [Lutzomyia longipalpis]|uniref:PDZ and LIM domain protein Zasp isoform X12 n=1 Tax=Lutzomyia longipalpis TaxID=7200 RepID=UPI002483F0BD|nr:PDZ and LIM domain protein Zasp isoform X12 [Lutzomyia longipalpis]
MAQLVTVRLSRSDAQPWGFRLQGGKDFGTPLVVQKVAGGSIAANAGLVAGDAVIKVNGMDVYNLRHKDAQDAVVRGGNNFEISVQRGGSTWRPTVSPAGSLPQPVLSGGSVAPVTHTSLAAKPQEVSHIGSGYNSSARPYLPSVNGDGVKSIVNKQYNTPVGMYSDETIAETLSAQAEVLAGGVLGVNFKKNERIYNSANSEVYKMLQEAENDPNDPEESSFSPTPYQSSNQQSSPSGGVTKHVTAPVAQAKPPNTGGLPAGQNICAECERLIVGVFVRIKEKNLHVDCFKCATCGTPLKNQGYFNINNKLYCDIHAKLAALNNPPPGTEGYLPVPIKPNTKLSASTISAALTTHHGTGAGATNGAPQLGSPLSTGSNTNLSCATNFASNSCVLPQALSSCESTPKKLSPMASVGVSPIHSRQNSLGSAMSDTDINHKNVYNILKNCQSDDTPGHRRTYLETDFTDTISECDSPDEGTRMVMVGHEKMQNGTHNSEFVYKTIGGGIIRSVQAPGKGKNINYKINTNISGPKPFNISSAPLSPPSAGPKSPSIYPPPTSAAAWSQPKPPSTFEAPKPSTFGSSTLPRANVGPAAPDGIDTVNRAADVHMAPPQIVTPVPHPRPFTPSLINKPAPIIPYYQQNLAVSEYDPQMGEIFDPHLRSPSPCLREKSPAPGPPPNPLRIQAPRLRESGQQPNLAPGTAFSCAQVKAESVYQQRPEMVECQRIGDNFRQTRTNEASLNRSLHAEKESASATQVGNTFIQKRSRVVEEFERTQSAKTIEIKTGGSGEVVSKITEDEMPPKGIVASQTRRFSQEVAPPKITFPAIIPVAPMNFPLGAAPQSSNTVAPPPGFNLKSLNAPSAFASAQSSHQNASTFAFTNAPPKIEATKPASGPVAAFKLPKPQTPPPPTNNCPGTTMSDPSPDASAGSKGGAAGVTSAPKRGRGVLNKAVGPGGRIPQCGCCNQHIRGPFITALGRIWCPDHFICVNGECRRPLADIGFVEEKGNLYCEYCFEKYIAPSCSKCGAKIKGDCLNAIGKHFHPECFTCAYCGKLFGNSPFFLEEGNPYCEADWNEMFTTKCFACGFPVEAGDRWVEALSHNYHSQCFNCTTCKKNLEGQSFFAKGGRPYCKNHAR